MVENDFLMSCGILYDKSAYVCVYHQSSSQFLFSFGLGPPAGLAIIICKWNISLTQNQSWLSYRKALSNLLSAVISTLKLSKKNNSIDIILISIPYPIIKSFISCNGKRLKNSSHSDSLKIAQIKPVQSFNFFIICRHSANV